MKSLLYVFMACLCASLGACAIAPGATDTVRPSDRARPVAEIPYRIAYRGWFTVDAMVNGQGPYDFIVDSGATITSAFANLADEQAFNEEPDRTITILGLSGAREMPAYFIGDIEIGGITFEDHTGVVLPDWAPPNTPPQGLIGLDFLSSYNVFFDTSDKQMRLYQRPDAPPLPAGWKRVPMTVFDDGGPGAKLYAVTIQVRSARIPCILDLGASGTIFNSAALRRMMTGVIHHNPYLNGRYITSNSRINDVFDVSVAATPLNIEYLRIGNASWTNGTYLAYDAKIFKDLGYGDKPVCLIGADMFVNRSFMFDFEGESLYIGPER